jgi:hypothetical protein
MRLVASIVGVGLLTAAFATSGQDSIADSMDTLREKLKIDKKLVIDSNLALTQAEAEKFWPMYEDYQKELERLNRRLEALVRRYAQAYRAGTLDDVSARELLQQAIAIGKDEIAMDEKYMKRLDGAIPTIEMVRYIQMEHKIRALFKYELSAQIPLVE